MVVPPLGFVTVIVGQRQPQRKSMFETAASVAD